MSGLPGSFPHCCKDSPQGGKHSLFRQTRAHQSAQCASLCALLGLDPRLCVPRTHGQLHEPLGPRPCRPQSPISGKLAITFEAKVYTVVKSYFLVPFFGTQ